MDTDEGSLTSSFHERIGETFLEGWLTSKTNALLRKHCWKLQSDHSRLRIPFYHQKTKDFWID